MDQRDYEALCKILQDDETMYAYEGAFSNEEVQEWLDINGTNYAAVTGINEGIVENAISPINSNIQDDIQSGKDKISNLKELNTEMKEYLYELLDEAVISISKNDNKLKDDCVNKFKGWRDKNPDLARKSNIR